MLDALLWFVYVVSTWHIASGTPRQKGFPKTSSHILLMGATQSLVSTEAAATAAALVVAIGLGYATMRPDEPPAELEDAATKEGKAVAKAKKGKKKAKTGLAADVSESGAGSEARVVPFPSVIPGQFDASVVVGADLGASTTESHSKMKKNKKKKGKVTPAVSEPESAPGPPSSKEAEREEGEATRTRSGKAVSGRKQPESSSSKRSAPAVEGEERKLVRPLAQSTASLDTDGSWTRVKSKKKSDLLAPSSATTSDAGPTGEESSVADQDVADSFLLTSDLSIRTSGETRKTLAEKLLPKPVKTNVDE